MPPIKGEVLLIGGIVVVLLFFATIWFIQWRMVRRVKRGYDKKDYQLADSYGKPRKLDWTRHSVSALVLVLSYAFAHEVIGMSWWSACLVATGASALTITIWETVVKLDNAGEHENNRETSEKDKEKAR
jgi:hypothetical protein